MPGVAKNKNPELKDKEEFAYFYSLVKPSAVKKKRRCLKCATVFLSAHYGNRTCGSCAAQNTRAALRAGQSW